MSIRYETIDIPFPKSLKRREATDWIKKVATQYQKKAGDIVCVFCSDAEILRINNQYLKHDYYTDIITFDYSDGDVLSGDLFISLDTIKSNAEKYETNYTEELYRVIIHGVLHLCGFNDKTSEDVKCMRQKEDESLRLLCILKSQVSSLRGQSPKQSKNII